MSTSGTPFAGEDFEYDVFLSYAWINNHEKQSRETLDFRADAEERISSLEERLQDLLNREH